ncbi:MAG: LLM class flavin-dependent oxidoreductase [Propionibacteriales bacterium]|nr:LLM class flavin-dependent oxidoreductase [Propionibacteriales bacterium]
MVPTLFTFEPCPMERLREAAAIGDAQDLEALWVGDHLLWNVPMHEAVSTLAMLGALTTRTKVGTNILQLPLRRPVDVAKSFATISWLTQGRVIMGVGIGGEFEAEWQAAGVDPRKRGRRCDEALQALQWFWNGDEQQGEHFVSPGVAIEPGPAEPVPIWVGGRSDAAIRRAARWDGYLGVWLSVSRYRRIREQIESERGGDRPFRYALQMFTRIADDRERARDVAMPAMARTYNMDPSPFEKYVAMGTPADVAEFVDTYREAGVDHVSFYLIGDDWSEQARRLSEEVLPLIQER